MYLNTITPALGSNKNPRRLGRGIGSGLGKTGGRGHKGQKSRSGNKMNRGFEGGQTPLYRRLPKLGFHSLKKFQTAQIILGDLEKINCININLNTLKKYRLVSKKIRFAKIISSGKISVPLIIHGSIRVSKGAQCAIETAGGKIEDINYTYEEK
ncbi:MAG: 50S ribosomal protein L15 [Candidatus Dasytiphilus stammeri]